MQVGWEFGKTQRKPNVSYKKIIVIIKTMHNIALYKNQIIG